MKTFFGRWWLPVLIHALVLSYFFISEYYAPAKSANHLNLDGAAVICVSCILLIISTIYQFVVKNFIAGLITALILIGTVSYLFI